MPKNYKKTTPEKKLSILKSDLLDKKPVSELCEENEVSPSNYYQWQKQLFDHGLESFDIRRKRKGLTHDQQEVRRLEAELAAAKAKLSARDEVVAELMQEHIHLKKTLGVL
jgi:transposase-like protein